MSVPPAPRAVLTAGVGVVRCALVVRLLDEWWSYLPAGTIDDQVGDLGLSYGQSGWLLALLTLGGLLGSPVAALADRGHRRLLATSGALVIAAGLSAFALAAPFPLLVVAATLLGGASDLMIRPLESSLADAAGGELDRLLGRQHLLTWAGDFVAPALLGIGAATVIGWRGVFTITLVVFVAFALRLATTEFPPPVADPDGAGTSLMRSARSLLRGQSSSGTGGSLGGVICGGTVPTCWCRARVAAVARRVCSGERPFSCANNCARGLSSPGGGSVRLPADAQPVQGRVVVAESARGSVTVRLPGTRRDVPIEDAGQIPVGSVVDASKGTAVISTALPGGKVQQGRFWGSRFTVRQVRRGAGITSIITDRSHIPGCPTVYRAPAAPTPIATTAATELARKRAKKRPRRILWGSDRRGRFRTHGRNSVATVRGTRWVTVDTCTGTLTRVVEGAVVVRDKRLKKSVLVRAGRQYFARRAR